MATTVNIYEMVDTWINSATTYTAIKMNVTDTSSAVGSKLIDLQVDSLVKFNVDKTGNLALAGTVDGRDVAADGVVLDGIVTEQTTQNNRLDTLDTEQTTQDTKINDLEVLGRQGYHMATGGPVAVATTANITLSGEQTIDGILTSNDRILVKDQTLFKENGIYVTAAGAWARASDMNLAVEVAESAVFVTSGTINGTKTFVTYSVVAILGTDNIVFKEGHDNSSVSRSYATRSEFVSYVAGGKTWTDGDVVFAGGFGYQKDSTVTAISDLLGWKPFITITPLHFNAKGDASTDDWQSIMNALDYLGTLSGGELYIPQQPGSYYRIGQALRARNPGITVRCESATTRIHCTGDNPTTPAIGWPQYGCWMLGTYTIININQTSGFALNAITISNETITTTTASNAGNFSVNDVCYISSTTSFTVGADPRPTWGQINVVTSIDAVTGVIGLRHPIQVSSIGAEITNLSSNGTTWKDADGKDSNEAQFATRDFKILGGWWSTQIDEAPYYGGGGAIDCHISPDRINARSGVAYGNMFGHCLLECRLEQTRKSGTELAYSSHNNLVNIVNALQSNKSASYVPPGGAVWINEGARDNTVNIKTLDCTSFAHDHAVQFVSSNGNIVNIDLLKCTVIPSSLIHFDDRAYVGTRPTTSMNIVNINKCIGGSSNFYIRNDGNGQLAQNSVTGNFFGAVTQNAIRMEGGANSQELIDVWCENGGIVVGSSTNYKVSGYVPDGIIVSGDFDVEINNGEYELQTDASRKLKKVKVRRKSHNILTGVTSVTTSTIQQNSFELMDEITFYLGTSIDGTTATKTFNMTLGGTVVFNYTTGLTSVDVQIDGKITYANANVAIVYYNIISQSSVVLSGIATIAGLTFDLSDEDIIWTLSTTAGTTSVRSIKVDAYSASAGE